MLVWCLARSVDVSKRPMRGKPDPGRKPHFLVDLLHLPGIPAILPAYPDGRDCLKRAVILLPFHGRIFNCLFFQISAQLHTQFPNSIDRLHFALHSLPYHVRRLRTIEMALGIFRSCPKGRPEREASVPSYANSRLHEVVTRAP